MFRTLVLILMTAFVSAAVAQEATEEQMISVSQSTTVERIMKTNMSPAALEEFQKELAEIGAPVEEVKQASVAYSAVDEVISVTAPEGSKLTEEHLFFIGARIGIVAPLGIDATYIDMRDGKKNFHAVVGGGISYDMKTIEAGAGWHPRGRAFYVGGRLKDVFMDERQFLGINPEVGWMKVWGKNQRVMGSIGLGVTKMVGRDYSLPITADIHFGIAVRVGK